MGSRHSISASVSSSSHTSASLIARRDQSRSPEFREQNVAASTTQFNSADTSSKNATSDAPLDLSTVTKSSNTSAATTKALRSKRTARVSVSATASITDEATHRSVEAPTSATSNSTETKKPSHRNKKRGIRDKQQRKGPTATTVASVMYSRTQVTSDRGGGINSLVEPQPSKLVTQNESIQARRTSRKCVGKSAEDSTIESRQSGGASNKSSRRPQKPTNETTQATRASGIKKPPSRRNNEEATSQKQHSTELKKRACMDSNIVLSGSAKTSDATSTVSEQSIASEITPPVKSVFRCIGGTGGNKSRGKEEAQETSGLRVTVSNPPPVAFNSHFRGPRFISARSLMSGYQYLPPGGPTETPYNAVQPSFHPYPNAMLHQGQHVFPTSNDPRLMRPNLHWPTQEYMPAAAANPFHAPHEGYIDTTRYFPQRSSVNVAKYAPRRDKRSRSTHAPQCAPQSHSCEPGRDGPTVSYVCGFKVTMIDPTKKVFVIDMLRKQTCMLIRQLLDEHLEQVELRGDTDMMWRTLYTYTKMDLPCSEVKSIKDLVQHIMNSTKKVIGKVYGRKRAANNLRPRSWKEPHVLLYQREEGLEEHTGVAMHFDGCHITWQLMLSTEDDYVGGGTYFRCLRKTIKLKMGQVLVHPGALFHKGVDITSGTRMLMVGFMDGFDPQIKDASKAKHDDPFYETRIVTV